MSGQGKRPVRIGNCPSRTAPVRIAQAFLTAALLCGIEGPGGAHAADGTTGEGLTTPVPDTQPTQNPTGIGRDAEPLIDDDDPPTAGSPGADDTVAPDTPRSPEAAVEILTDLDLLPAPVRRTRERLLEAARTGDPEALRPIIALFESDPMVLFDGQTDAVDDLVAASGDDEGREILAILIEVLEAGFVHIEDGGANEVYVWPYFAHVPLDGLTPPQVVELFEIVTAYDLADMKRFGAYNFYRLGIAPDGQWVYFVAGD